MSDWKHEQKRLAGGIMTGQLGERLHPFAGGLAGIDSEAITHGRYGGGAWYAARYQAGRDELRKRAEIIRGAWRQALDGQSARRAKKLRPIAAEEARSRFMSEARTVADFAIPKQGSQYGAGDPKALDESIGQLADELDAVLRIPPTAPERNWFMRRFETQADAAISLIVVAAVTALLARGADIWQWVRSLFPTATP